MPVGSELDTPLAGRKEGELARQPAAPLERRRGRGGPVNLRANRVVLSVSNARTIAGGEMAEDRQVLMGVLAGTTAAAALQHLLD